jgi:hypothetical protein
MGGWQLPVTIQATTPGPPKLLADQLQHSVQQRQLQLLQKERAAQAAAKGDARCVLQLSCVCVWLCP